jgi:hypothetical protein
MDAPKKSIGEIMEEYNRLHNIPIDVTASITHNEFVRGLRDGTVGFAPKGGEPIRLVSGIGRVFFNVSFFLYLLAPILVIPLWAYHERNWWLLLGIIVACLIAPQLAQRKGSTVGGILLLASIVLFFTKGIHNYFTFFSLCALWSYCFFQIAEAVQIEGAEQALIKNPELFHREIATDGLYIWRKRTAQSP